MAFFTTSLRDFSLGRRPVTLLWKWSKSPHQTCFKGKQTIFLLYHKNSYFSPKLWKFMSFWKKFVFYKRASNIVFQSLCPSSSCELKHLASELPVRVGLVGEGLAFCMILSQSWLIAPTNHLQNLSTSFRHITYRG